MDKQDPHAFLGLCSDKSSIFLYAPGQKEVYLEVLGQQVRGEELGNSLFVYRVGRPITAKEYRVIHPSGLIAHDPYTFSPTFSREDISLFERGELWNVGEVMGGRLCTHQKIQGVKFSVWAPNAAAVSLVGDFNQWIAGRNPMRKISYGGIWELFVPGLQDGERYKFVIGTKKGATLFKADPYAYQGEMRPHTASVITRIDLHTWSDQEWVAKRRKYFDKPLNIYKLHLGCWKTEGGVFKNYRELAPLIVAYLKKMHFTHVELLPIMGHPHDASWGYQVTGFYAISKRYGTVEDFQWFVDYLHQRDIGIIFDWVPAHFPSDDYALAQFDGTFLYEHEDPKLGYHPKWDTLIFNYGKKEVTNFLIGSALFYLKEMHIDGLRVDAVSSVIYLDFERESHQWIPNAAGGNENVEGIQFFKKLNQKVHEQFPTALMIAEESHAYPGVTNPEQLGFDLRWDLGWSIDTFTFFQADEKERFTLIHHLIHEMTYFYNEDHILPLSHDAVTHGRKSLLSKMPGREWEQFANLRLLLSYTITHPGKKLFFMGGELGQKEEWNCNDMLPWDLLDFPHHRGIYQCARALNELYLNSPALHASDFLAEGFEWAEPHDLNNLVLAYFRRGGGETFFVLHNFSSKVLDNYTVFHLPKGREIFSTDAKEYQGSGILNPNIEASQGGITLTLPPLATLVLNIS